MMSFKLYKEQDICFLLFNMRDDILVVVVIFVNIRVEDCDRVAELIF